MNQEQPPHRLAALATRALLITLLTLGSVSLLLLTLGLSPVSIARALAQGSIFSWLTFSHVLSIWAPLVLCGCCLLFTFRAGLWNIGVEGQVMVGAIFATMILRMWPSSMPPVVFLILALFFGALGGGLWGCCAGLLKNRGGVHEIFGGLGLNFVAQALVLWLIFGPWKRTGIASMSGTDLLPRHLWLPIPQDWRVAPAALLIAGGALLCTALLLSWTRFGLQVKAVGKNPTAARLFGIRPHVTTLSAITLGGCLAGLAGGLQVTGVYHRLIPSISSGYGYLALLIVMLAGYNLPATPVIGLFFAFLATGSIQLPIVLQVDSSLSGVIQGACVLSALVIHGLQQRKEHG